MRKRRIAIAAASAAVLALLTAPIAQAADVTVRQPDLNCSETRAQGHNDLQKNRVHVYTESNTSLDKAACYFGLPGETLNTIGEPTMEWLVKVGSPQVVPGQQIVLSPSGILVGEPVYSGASTGDPNGDWWLTNGAPDALKQVAPSCDGTPDAVTDPAAHCSGGGGSYWHGTLDAWRTAAGTTPVLAGGWSLGSGVFGDGYLTQMTYGDDTFEFTNVAPPTPTNATAYDNTTTQCRIAHIRVGVNTLAANQAPGADTNVKVRVRVDGTTVFGPTQLTYGQSFVINRLFTQRANPSTVRVAFDGSLAGLHNVPRNCA